jgi:hypothetical protein
MKKKESNEYGLVAGYLKAGKKYAKKFRRRMKRNYDLMIGTGALHRWGIGPQDYLPKRKYLALCREHGKAMMEAFGRSLASDMTIVNELEGPAGSLVYLAPPATEGTLLGGNFHTPDAFTLRFEAWEKKLKEEAYRPDKFTGIFRKTGMQIVRPRRRRKGLHSLPMDGGMGTHLGSEESLIPDAIYLKLDHPLKGKTVRVAMKTRLTGKPRHVTLRKSMTMYYRDLKRRKK